ncbi:MAG: peptide-methionine (R)-S-oxide reductase, partial [Bradymonadia bacterium]
MAAEDPKKITLAEWSQRLDADSFRVAREGGTERPFTGKYWDTFDDGSYHCICCNALLFEANSKFSAHC